jgi:hypothetical protein
MMKIFVSVLALSFVSLLPGHASELPPDVSQIELVPVAVEAPAKIMFSREVSLVLREELPNSCVRPGPAETRVAGYDIYIHDTAYRYEAGPCTDALFLHRKTVELGALPVGTYHIWSESRGATALLAEFSVIPYL